MEKSGSNSKEVKRPVVVRVEFPGKTKTSIGGGEKLSHPAGQVDEAQGYKNQAIAVVQKPHEVPQDKKKVLDFGQSQKGEVAPKVGAVDAGDVGEEGMPPDAVGVAVEVWETDQLLSKGWQFERAGNILRVSKTEEPDGETPGLFEDAIIQNRVRSVLIAAGHSEAAESVKVSGGVVFMVLDPKDGGDSLLRAIEAAFSVLGVQRLEVSPRF